MPRTGVKFNAIIPQQLLQQFIVAIEDGKVRWRAPANVPRVDGGLHLCGLQRVQHAADSQLVAGEASKVHGCEAVLVALGDGDAGGDKELHALADTVANGGVV